MRNLQEATERICELKGSLVALDAWLPAVVDALPAAAVPRLSASFEAHAEAARTVLLHADLSDVVLAGFEQEVARLRAAVARRVAAAPAPPVAGGLDELLLATTPVTTCRADQVLTRATGFFFRRGAQLFLVSNRHVFCDVASDHFPDRVDIGVHTDARDLTQHAVMGLPLYRGGLSQWREAADTGGLVDVAALEVPAERLPPGALVHAFDATHLHAQGEAVALGDALTVVGFPLGFHDTVHHLAVARSAAMASAYGVRFQQQGCFLTDARTHRGSSGSPVVRRRSANAGSPAALASWQLLGVHSTRMDMRTRDKAEDESLGLNAAWYADVLAALTDERPLAP